MANTRITVGATESNFEEYDLSTRNFVNECCDSVLQAIQGGSGSIEGLNEQIGTNFTDLVKSVLTNDLIPHYQEVLQTWMNLIGVVGDFSQYINLVKAANDNIYYNFVDRSQVRPTIYEECERVNISTRSFDQKYLVAEPKYAFRVGQGKVYLDYMKEGFSNILQVWNSTIVDNLHRIMDLYRRSGNETIYANLASYSNEIKEILNEAIRQVQSLIVTIDHFVDITDQSLSGTAISLNK